MRTLRSRCIAGRVVLATIGVTMMCGCTSIPEGYTLGAYEKIYGGPYDEQEETVLVDSWEIAVERGYTAIGCLYFEGGPLSFGLNEAAKVGAEVAVLDYWQDEEVLDSSEDVYVDPIDYYEAGGPLDEEEAINEGRWISSPGYYITVEDWKRYRWGHLFLFSRVSPLNALSEGESQFMQEAVRVRACGHIRLLPGLEMVDPGPALQLRSGKSLREGNKHPPSNQLPGGGLRVSTPAPTSPLALVSVRMSPAQAVASTVSGMPTVGARFARE